MYCQPRHIEANDQKQHNLWDQTSKRKSRNALRVLADYLFFLILGTSSNVMFVIQCKLISLIFNLSDIHRKNCGCWTLVPRAVFAEYFRICYYITLLSYFLYCISYMRTKQLSFVMSTLDLIKEMKWNEIRHNVFF